jgi:hypothetical protein
LSVPRAVGAFGRDETPPWMAEEDLDMVVSRL